MKYWGLVSIFIVISLSACKNNKELSGDTIPLNEEISHLDVIVEDTVSQPWPDESEEQKNRILKGVVDSLFFKIERTSCFGRCPTYEISVFNSGYVLYHGKRNVKLIGFYQAFIGEEQLKLILQKAQEADFFNLDEKYDGNMTDVPSTITVLQQNDNVKLVVDRVRGPEQLKQFQREMDELLFNLDYKLKKMY